ncbi:MAG: DUF1460 domain-containing protein [Prevotella sp.]|nr:DUF1460 domain-containing protein [Prevotella sp.]
MKKAIILMIYFCFFNEVKAYHRDDSIFVEKLFMGVPQEIRMNSSALMLYYGRMLKGIPYVGHTLDRTDDEQMVVNLQELDCTTYLENVVALTLCTKHHQSCFRNYVNQLKLIRYRQGELSYENRLHYYQWWVEDNEKMGFINQIETPIPPFSGVQILKINYMSTNANSYDMLRNHPERVDALKKMEDNTNGKIIHYIPKSSVRNTQLLRKTIQDGDIITIVTQKKNLDTTHLGIAVWHEDGLHLLNASSIHKKVVEEPMTLFQYLQKHPSSIGIRVARVK